MNLLTTEQQKELDKWYTQYSAVNKRRPTWGELCSKAEEIMKKELTKQSTRDTIRLTKEITQGDKQMKELVLKKLKKLGADVEVDVREDKIIVNVRDFDGFTEDWEEIYRDYDKEAVGEFLEWLEEQCSKSYGDLYEYYEFDGFTVEVGYDSFDI